MTPPDKTHIDTLASLLGARGYTSTVCLTPHVGKLGHHFGTLAECLGKFVQDCQDHGQTKVSFGLETYVAYDGEDDYVHCLISAKYLYGSGFQLTDLFVTSIDGAIKTQLTFQLTSNDQVLTADMVTARARPPQHRQHTARHRYHGRRSH